MEQLRVQLANLPISLICTSSGHIGFVRLGEFKTIIDQQLSGISAVINTENMLVGDTEIEYNSGYNYREIPELVQWLVQQELISPIKG